MKLINNTINFKLLQKKISFSTQILLKYNSIIIIESSKFLTYFKIKIMNLNKHVNFKFYIIKLRVLKILYIDKIKNIFKINYYNFIAILI